MIRTELLRRIDGGLKLEVSASESQVWFVEMFLDFLMQSVDGDIDLARQWARIYREFYGHRFIAGNVRFPWIDEMIKEGLVLEANSEEEFELLRLRDQREAEDAQRV